MLAARGIRELNEMGYSDFFHANHFNTHEFMDDPKERLPGLRLDAKNAAARLDLVLALGYDEC